MYGVVVELECDGELEFALSNWNVFIVFLRERTNKTKAYNIRTRVIHTFSLQPIISHDRQPRSASSLDQIFSYLVKSHLCRLYRTGQFSSLRTRQHTAFLEWWDSKEGIVEPNHVVQVTVHILGRLRDNT